MTAPDPQTLYAACRELEDATGREIVPCGMEHDGTRWVHELNAKGMYTWPLADAAAARILRDALWEAVREWAVSREFGCIHQADRGYFVWDSRTVNCRVQEPIVQYTHDLPAAAHAIAEWCKANRTTPPAQESSPQ